ncbi:hypothetical protein [Mycobacteroides salmoniphilum]|uniref:hypothetical protein n=1 Tax=Mycobacteroides salmoniphilum TaxID=404941 RepID=UPI0010AA58CD|nr:hypothetical protein [Mycobacteroides salmoniphilum]
MPASTPPQQGSRPRPLAAGKGVAISVLASVGKGSAAHLAAELRHALTYVLASARHRAPSLQYAASPPADGPDMPSL